MSEHQVNKYFLQQKNKWIKKLGRRPLYSDELETICNKLFGSKFREVVTQDKFDDRENGYHIVNTDLSTGPGIHWCVIVVTPKRLYIFDSFGRPFNELLKFVRTNKDIIEADKDQNQKGNSEVCGHQCIAFLQTAKKYGILKAIKYI